MSQLAILNPPPVLSTVGLVPAGLVPAVSVESLFSAWLAGRKPDTIRAYRAGADDFASFLGMPGEGMAAVKSLLQLPHGPANALALAYRTHMQERHLAPATINARLAALRSLTQLGSQLGVVNWTLDVPSLKSQPYRDTRGIGDGGYAAIVQAIDAREDDPKARRDRAILALLYLNGLRRSEVVDLDLADVEFETETGSIWIMGKGRVEKERLTCPPAAMELLAKWCDSRGREPGPLFFNLSRAHERRRLSDHAVWSLVTAYGTKAGITARPHGVRHQSITKLLDLTNGDVRRVQKFSRHKRIETLLIYDDQRRDVAGEMANLLAGES